MKSIEQSEKFMDDMVNVIKSKFPNSKIYWKRGRMFGSTFYTVYFCLAENETEVANSIWLNDALCWKFDIDTCNDKGELFDEIIIENNDTTICRGIDVENYPNEKYLAFGRIKVSYRKIKGDENKCIEKMKKFIDKTAEIMIENADLINQGTIKGLFDVRDKITL